MQEVRNRPLSFSCNLGRRSSNLAQPRIFILGAGKGRKKKDFGERWCGTNRIPNRGRKLTHGDVAAA